MACANVGDNSDFNSGTSTRRRPDPRHAAHALALAPAREPTQPETYPTFASRSMSFWYCCQAVSPCGE